MSTKTKATKKRTLEEANSTTPKAKKSKLSDGTKSVKAKQDNREERAKVTQPLQTASNLVAEDIDFPRGGGTSFTPLEVKAIRAEGLKEAEDELFKVRLV
jgi:rRNA biogenesis protein RRP5